MSDIMASEEENEMKIKAMSLAFATFAIFVLTEIVSFPTVANIALSLAIGIGGVSALFLAIRQHG